MTLTRKLVEVHSLAIFHPGIAFMTCTSEKRNGQRGLYIIETAFGFHPIATTDPHNICTASKTDQQTASASSASSLIRRFYLTNLNCEISPMTVSFGSGDFPSSLGFVPDQSNL